MSDKRMQFLNTYVDNLTMAEAVEEAKRLVLADHRSYVVTPNVDHIVKIEHDKLFRQIYRDADLILTDGKPLVWISRWLGRPIKEKISGSDYFPNICTMAAKEGFSIYLLGAAPGVAKRASANLEKEYPGLKIAGTYSPSFHFESSPVEIDSILHRINTAKPDILCIGLGTPKQEKFYYLYRDQMNVPLTLHIGATIDFAAGVVKRAPYWMSYVGLEWLYRLLQEPKRLYRRYLMEDVEIVPIFRKYRRKLRYEERSVCNILGVNVAVTNMHRAVNDLTDHLERMRGEYVCVSNVHTTVMAYENEEYRRIQNQAVMAVPDGMPLALLCRLRGYSQARRVAGPDLMPEILRLSEKRGYKHYFYGSTEKTLKSLVTNLKRQFPGLNIVGTYSPPFRKLTEQEDQEIVDGINAAKPDYIWVGLGAPKQENWMYEHRGRVNGLMLGVGAAFDFHAGTVKRAPRWMQECYLEWLYRLLQDPRRLFGRYLKTNLKFMWLMLRGK